MHLCRRASNTIIDIHSVSVAAQTHKHAIARLNCLQVEIIFRYLFEAIYGKKNFFTPKELTLLIYIEIIIEKEVLQSECYARNVIFRLS